MKKILAIVGSSGSGKTTLSEHLRTIGIEPLVSFTTRPMRKRETNGIEHHFVKENVMPMDKREMLAYAHFGNYDYWTTTQQIEELGSCISYIIDEKALLEMVERFKGKYDIIPIYVKRDDLTDIERHRRNRDNDRLILPDKYYAAVIENNGTIKEFLKKAEDTIKKLIGNGSTEE